MVLYKISFPSRTTKVYIGITSRPIEYRVREHLRCNRNTFISNAIKKHGTPYVVVLGECDDIELICLAEQEAISKYNSIHPNGYNRTEGGEITLPSKERNERIRSSMVGRKHSKETKEKMSSSAKSRIKTIQLKKTEQTIDLVEFTTTELPKPKKPKKRRLFQSTGAMKSRLLDRSFDEDNFLDGFLL